MKRVIGGKSYDTATATHICQTIDYGYPGDFESCDESLYRTKKGTYFIAGEGGPMSKYATSCGGGDVSSGEGMEIISKEQARQLAEEAGLDAEDMVAAGFDVEEG